MTTRSADAVAEGNHARRPNESESVYLTFPLTIFETQSLAEAAPLNYRCNTNPYPFPHSLSLKIFL